MFSNSQLVCWLHNSLRLKFSSSRHTVLQFTSILISGPQLMGISFKHLISKWFRNPKLGV